MWDFFIRNNAFAYIFLVALVAVGTYSILSIPRESTPEVVLPYGMVTTVFPGAPAADVEALITNELERGLTNVENVKQITSVSRESMSMITVEFEAHANIDDAIQDLKDEVDMLKGDLPDDANDPSVVEFDFNEQPIVTLSVAGDLSPLEMNRLATDVEREIESVSGVSRVEISGVPDKAITVIVDQAALERFSLNLNAVTSAIASANQTFPIGQITNNGISYNIAFEGDVENAADLAEVGIGLAGGQPVFLRDVAKIEDGLASASSISRLSINGEPSQSAMTVNVYKRSGGDITVISKAVREHVTELQAEGQLLADMSVAVVTDMGELINNDLVNLITSGLQTVLLVVIMLIIAIGWREGLLAGSAIPLSFLFGFIGLYFSGNTINFLSLFSLILGVGILVDSAIVMVEGVNRKMKDNPTIDKREAAISTVHEFAWPLISGTMTTVSMFAGLFIVSGIIGQFIHSIPFTLIFLLMASLFVTLAILPLFAANFLKRRSATKFEQQQTAQARKLEEKYKRTLRPIIEDTNKQDIFLSAILAALVAAILLTVNLVASIITLPVVYYIALWFRRRTPSTRWRKIGYMIARPIVIVVAAVIITTAAASILPVWNPVEVIFFEQSDADYVIVEIEQPEGTTKEVTDIATRRVEELLYDEPEIESFTIDVGSGSAYGSGGTGEKLANIFINLRDDRDRTSTEIVEDLRTQVAPLNDIVVTVDQPSDGPPTGAPVVIKFLGDDLSEITTLANQASNILRSTPGLVNIQSSTNSNNTEFVLTLDRAKAAAAGVSPAVISQTARAAVFGADATSLTSLTEDIDVVVKLNINNAEMITNDTSDNFTITRLAGITIATPTGPVPLSSLVTLTLRESSAAIDHEDNKRVVSLTADVDANTNAITAQAEALQKIRTELAIPDDVEISTGGGESEDSNAAFAEMGLALVIGILLMVAVLVLQFNSYLYTRYVLSIIPYSLIGIFFGLAITGNALSFPAMMGFIALTGIVVNNSILLIDMMNAERRKNPSKNIEEVVLDTAGNRLRPILLTSATTVIGMVPLVAAGDMWAPLAYAVMFGLIFSVVITLVLIPVIYTRNPGELPKVDFKLATEVEIKTQ